jgi:hypothetical protein
MNRWALFIDIEGFSSIFKENETRAICLIGGLLADTVKVVEKISIDSYRLFVHHLGDCLTIVSYSEESTLRKPIDIGVSLMQAMLYRGGILKMALSQGEFGDYLGCFSKIRDKIENGRIRINQGIMTVLPLFGSAYVNASDLHKSIKGPCFVIDSRISEKIPENVVRLSGNENIEINWLKTKSPGIEQYTDALDISVPNPEQLKQKLQYYLDSNPLLPSNWQQYARSLINS